MKKLFSLTKNAIAVFVMAVVMASMFSVCTYAADTVEINGEAFNKGDQITYSVMFKCDKKLSGINASVTYDKDSLELAKESVNIPNLGSLAIANPDMPGVVNFIGTDIGSGIDFTEEKLIVSMTFKVKNEAKNNDLKIDFVELLDVDLENVTVDGYTFNESVTAGEYEGEVTTLGNGDEIIEKDQKEQKKIQQTTTTQAKQPMSKSTVVWIVIGVLVAVAVAVSVVIKVVNNKPSAGAKLSEDEKKILSDKK